MTKELIEAIERLGNQLGIISELSTNIYNEIKMLKKEPNHTKDIWKIKSYISTAEYYYTRFHTNISRYSK